MYLSEKSNLKLFIANPITAWKEAWELLLCIITAKNSLVLNQL